MIARDGDGRMRPDLYVVSDSESSSEDRRHARDFEGLKTAGIELIDRRRRELGMSRKRLSARLRVSPGTLENFEKGATRIGAETLVDICRILKIQPSALFETYMRHSSPGGHRAADARGDAARDASPRSAIAQLLHGIIRDAESALAALERQEAAGDPDPDKR